jgi:hypothetical protein
MDFLEAKEARKLLEKPGLRIPTGGHPVCHGSPLSEFHIAQAKTGRKARPSVWPAFAQQGSHVQGSPNVPARHHVGKGVVVDVLVIFIRPDYTANVGAAVCLRPGTARPEPPCLEEDFGACFEEEAFVSGRLSVLPDRVGDVCGNVLFLLAAKDLHDPSIGTDRLFRRRLLTGVG